MSGFVLTDNSHDPRVNDIVLLEAAFRCRLLQQRHFGALTGRSAKSLERRLLQLARNGYLGRKKLAHTPYVYFASSAGQHELLVRGRIKEQELRPRAFSDLKPLYADHELMLTDIHVALWLAAKNGPLTFTRWEQGRGLHASVVIDRQRLPWRPDALVAFEDSRRQEGRNKAAFFLEADRSSEGHRQFAQKLQAYWAALNAKMHEKRYGIPSFRVLTFCLTDARARNLCGLTRATLPKEAWKFFLFTDVGYVALDDPARVLDEVFLAPRDHDKGLRYPLIRAPQATATAAPTPVPMQSFVTGPVPAVSR